MIRFIACSLIVIVGVVGCSDPTGPDTHVELRVDADVYHVGEDVQVELINHHAFNSNRVWYYPCSVTVERQDGDVWELVGAMGNSCGFYRERLQPGDSHGWSFTIDRYRTRGGGEASYEPGRMYRFITSIRDWNGERSRERWTGIYSRPFVVQD